MAYTQLYYHIVWRTKDSMKAIAQEHERELYAYLFGYCQNHNYKLFRIGGMEDHIHMFLQLPPTVAVASMVHDIKISAYRFMMQHKELFPLFTGWGDGYCALTKGEIEKEKIIHYIKSQKEHHSTTTFQEELRALLEENGIPYKEEYL